MSLDARIRQLAAEAVAEASTAGGDSGTAAALRQQLVDHQAQLKDLHEHHHRALTQIEQLAERVSALEGADAAPPPTEPEQEQAPRRSSRRRSEP